MIVLFGQEPLVTAVYCVVTVVVIICIITPVVCVFSSRRAES
jgi:hypothetical protein